MTPGARKFMPLLGPLVVGALAYLVIGEGPSSAPVRAGETAAWELPSLADTGTAASATVWAARAPWGAEVEPAQAEAVVATRPVGVVEVGERLFALFTQGDAVVRVAQDEALPDGGTVTRIGADVVEWIDGAGATQRRELLVDVVQAGPASSPDASAGARALNRGNRQGQRRARTNVPGSSTERPNSRLPSSTGG